ncbi:MAG: hypothetical protein KAI99_11825, partial [Cyclobacteriaceae bacterium]|nr:hypothetical protein [Cyclobacteriaceae bacterium]
MRGALFFIFSIIATLAICKEESDSTKSPIAISGAVSLNSNGIAPIPSFTYGKPVITANFSLRKNRFSYDPQLSYGFDLKPWTIDNWFHYQLIDNQKFELRTGLNVAMFFSEYKAPYDTIWQGQRY